MHFAFNYASTQAPITVTSCDPLKHKILKLFKRITKLSITTFRVEREQIYIYKLIIGVYIHL